MNQCNLMKRHILGSRSKALLFLYNYNNAATAVGIQKLFSLSARFGTLSATQASCAKLIGDEDSETSEDEDWFASRIIQDKDLLRSSLHISGTGLHVLDLVNCGSLEADRTLYNKLLHRCTQTAQLKQARIVHSHILTSQFKDDLPIRNTILHMYVKCGSLDDAHNLFYQMPHKDLVTWTALISGYSQHDRPQDALVLFPEMLRHGLEPNQFTLSSLLKASGAVSDDNHGRQLHTYCFKYGLDSNVYVGTALVDMYARCGHMDESQLVFDALDTKNEVSWNALIAGHARKAQGEHALRLFWKMLREGFKPTHFTYSSVLTACASAGSLEQGKWVHAHMIKSAVTLVAFVGNTLLDMYAKSGSIEDAKKVFDRMVRRDVVSWNSMLTGYAQHGLGKETVQRFEEMLRIGIQPNDITFLCVLTACSHAGLLDEGQYYFDLMKQYNIEPQVSHYVTVVDLLGRGNLLDRAEKFIREMPIEPTAAVWGALLGACRMHKNIVLGAYAAERSFELDPHDSGPHVILSNIYASAGRWIDAAKVRKMMKEGGVKKEPACSWVDIENAVHMFVANDDAHPQKVEILRMWEMISMKIKEIGYVPDTSHVLFYVDQQEREVKLQYHSEKLALAFALLNTPPLSLLGMTCGGCAASVKRILENQPQVSSASVNLTTETAIVWPVSEEKAAPNWQKQLGETLANQLTSCGFKSNLRDSGRDNFLKVFERKMEEKRKRLKDSGNELAFSWALCAVCLVGHASHFFGAKAPWIHALHSTGFHLSLCLFTLLGPGRRLIFDGLRSLVKGAPNMNTLVGLGALSSFTVSSLAAFIPKLGWKTFFEEPIMLIAFVLLGRNLEQRAKIKASSDMTELLSIVPSKARLLVNNGEQELESVVEVSTNSLSVGDKIVVLPGDRVPVDGIVKAGRSIIDESSFTGEPLPVTKLPGSQVAAGSINLNGTLTVEVQRPGGETAMADIVRLVEEAQSREAPVQRLADKVSGHFTYGVMTLSAATFLFWSLIGGHILPAAFHGGNSVSLALQLSCSVLVVACPCALGLATPTAVLVGTSLGAKRGLLLRGGSILEKFSMVNTIVFDKTGTLTVGKPVVTKIVTPERSKVTDLKEKINHTWSEVDVLKFAAGVESNTVHPVAKAIVEASQALNCQNMKVADGTFLEEPGSGAVATVENKKVSVGTLEWVQRHGVTKNPFDEVEAHTSQSIVYVGIDSTLAGLIYLEDQIREDAGQVVKSLSKQGIDVYMLSGDKRNNAEYVASAVGIPKEKVISGVKPTEKKKFIMELQKDQNIVAMVGDGINDAAALAASHVGIAMGGGVGAASEVSSIVLLGNRLSQLLDALELSRLTMKTVKQNLWWAFAYNIVGLPIAAGVLLPVTGTILTPSIAGGLMGLSSVGVMANSLFLRYKFSKQEQKYSGSARSKTNEESDLLIDISAEEEHPRSDGKWKE